VPRIRRWHPVSHDLIKDREFLALLDLHPRLGYMWLEMLAEADKNEGRVTGSMEEIAHGFGRLINPLFPWKGRHWTRVGLEYMVGRGWVEVRQRVSREGVEVEQRHLYVRNYLEFHPRREQASSPRGSKLVPGALVSTSPSLKPSNGFEEFWERYPQQEGKGKAEESWGKHTRGVQLEEILAGLEKWQGSQKWADGFITLPATWINQKRWKDNPRQAKSRSQAKLLWDQAQAEKEKKE